MGKKAIIIFGIGVMCLGLFGVVKALQEKDEPLVENMDLTADGIVTSTSKSDFKSRRGFVVDTTYRVEFSFEAEDGKTYVGHDNIKAEHFGILAKGTPIEVRYYSSHPNISASPYGFYSSARHAQPLAFGSRMKMCSGIIIFGLLVVLLGRYAVVDEASPSKRSAVDLLERHQANAHSAV